MPVSCDRGPVPSASPSIGFTSTGRDGGTSGKGGGIVADIVTLDRFGPIAASKQTAITLADAARRVQELADAAKKVNPEILVLCHGGPISEPEDVRYVLGHTKGVVGFFGASSIERLPTEVAITYCVRQFKGLSL